MEYENTNIALQWKNKKNVSYNKIKNENTNIGLYNRSDYMRGGNHGDNGHGTGTKQ